MKQFVKALDHDGDCFYHICPTFPSLSEENKKTGVVDGPQLRTLLRDATFVTTVNEVEARAWNGFSEKLPWKQKADNYKEIVKELSLNFLSLGCKMSIKLHYFQSHLSNFPENLDDISEEQGESFHQDDRIMEVRYQGKWDSNMMADYCWSSKIDVPDAVQDRK